MVLTRGYMGVLGTGSASAPLDPGKGFGSEGSGRKYPRVGTAPRDGVPPSLRFLPSNSPWLGVQPQDQAIHHGSRPWPKQGAPRQGAGTRMHPLPTCCWICRSKQAGGW